jgi:hypothetical protein
MIESSVKKSSFKFMFVICNFKKYNKQEAT